MFVGGGGGVADVGGAGGAGDGDVEDGLGLVDVRVGDVGVACLFAVRFTSKRVRVSIIIYKLSKSKSK